MTAPMCRNCQHATWVKSPSGKQIKQRTPGRCSKAYELARAHGTGAPPCVWVETARIWPNDKAGQCPGFVRKTRDDTACA